MPCLVHSSCLSFRMEIKTKIKPLHVPWIATDYVQHNPMHIGCVQLCSIGFIPRAVGIGLQSYRLILPGPWANLLSVSAMLGSLVEQLLQWHTG